MASKQTEVHSSKDTKVKSSMETEVHSPKNAEVKSSKETEVTMSQNMDRSFESSNTLLFGEVYILPNVKGRTWKSKN